MDTGKLARIVATGSGGLVRVMGPTGDGKLVIKTIQKSRSSFTAVSRRRLLETYSPAHQPSDFQRLKNTIAGILGF